MRQRFAEEQLPVLFDRQNRERGMISMEAAMIKRLKSAFRASMRKFINYGFSDDTAVYPGHGESTDYAYLLKHNPDIIGIIKS